MFAVKSGNVNARLRSMVQRNVAVISTKPCENNVLLSIRAKPWLLRERGDTMLQKSKAGCARLARKGHLCRRAHGEILSVK